MSMQYKYIFSLLTLTLLASKRQYVDSSRILTVYSFPGKSHSMMTTALTRELVEKGHEVTSITAYTLAHLKLGSNYTEILIEPTYDFWDDIQKFFKTENLFELTSMNLFGFLDMLQILGVQTTRHALEQPKVQAIINATKTENVYDLLIVEQFYQEAFLTLALKYNIPSISVSTLGYENYMSQMMGVLSPWSFVPHGFMPFTDHMSFFERLQNCFYSLYEDWHREYVYFPKMDELVEKHFSHLPIAIPKVSEMEKKISVMLLNSHAPLTSVRPTIDGMIPVGGLHIYPPKPLPEDIKAFLDNAVHGAIYFSLGSNVQSKDMPADKLKIFLSVFARLKQRVLWKFESESITALPGNVMIKKWLPQSDILAHPNVKVFITHGGLFGTQEGVYHQVPMLGMPFYCDQHLNMNKAVQSGYAISLHFQAITEEILSNALTQLMENATYRENIKRISHIFRDRPLSARETAVYWVEYVIRHKGARHLHSAGLDLKWYQFYLLDVAAFVVGGALISVILIIVGLCLCLKGRQHKTKRE